MILSHSWRFMGKGVFIYLPFRDYCCQLARSRSTEIGRLARGLFRPCEKCGSFVRRRLSIYPLLPTYHVGFLHLQQEDNDGEEIESTILGSYPFYIRLTTQANRDLAGNEKGSSRDSTPKETETDRCPQSSRKRSKAKDTNENGQIYPTFSSHPRALEPPYSGISPSLRATLPATEYTIQGVNIG